MIALLLAAASAAPAQTDSWVHDPARRAPDEVVTTLRAASRPVGYDVRRTTYHLPPLQGPEVYAELRSYLQPGLEEPPPAIADILARVERSLPLEYHAVRFAKGQGNQGFAGVRPAEEHAPQGPLLQRILERPGRSLRFQPRTGHDEGSRILVDRLSPENGREMRWDAPSGTLLFGTHDAPPGLRDPFAWDGRVWDSLHALGPLSLHGELGHQLLDASWDTWERPGAGDDGSSRDPAWLVHMESEFRLIELYVQMNRSTPSLPVHCFQRAPRAPRTPAFAWIMEWEELDGAPFPTAVLQIRSIQAQDNVHGVIVLNHVERSSITFDVDANDVVLDIHEPKSLERAKGGDWSVLRTFEALPRGWGDMLRIREER